MEHGGNPFLRAISLLEESGIDYVIVGGFAVVMYGCNRFTPDLNVMVSFEDRGRLSRLLENLLGEEFVPTTDSDTSKLLREADREALFDSGRRWFFSFRDLDNPSFSFDLFLHFPVPFKQVSSERVQLVAGDQPFSICSMENLIAMKSIAGRGQDKADIGALTLIRKIAELQTNGSSDSEILELGGSDAEREQIEGFLKFVSLTPRAKLEWLAEMLHHLGKFCVG